LGTTKVLAQRYSYDALRADTVLHSDQTALMKVEPIYPKQRLTSDGTKVRDLPCAHVYVEQPRRVIGHEQTMFVRRKRQTLRRYETRVFQKQLDLVPLCTNDIDRGRQ